MKTIIRNDCEKKERDFFFIMFGFTFFSGSMLVGSEMAANIAFEILVESILIGGLVLGLFGGLLAYYSCKFEKDLLSMATDTFGDKGSNIVTIIISITQIGWFGVGVQMLTTPLTLFFSENARAANLIGTVCFGLLMLISATGGIKLITKLSYLAVPVIFILGLTSIFLVLHMGFEYHPMQKSESFNVSVGISMVVGTYIAGAITTPNFSNRIGKPILTAIIAFVAFGVGNGLMLCFGAASYYLVGGNDIFDLFRYFGAVWLGFIVMGLNIWSSCDNGLYSAGLGLHSVFHKDRKITTIVIGVLGTTLSPLIYNHLTNFLEFLNMFIPCVGVSIIIHFVMCGRTWYKNNNIGAIASLIVGDLAACVSSKFPIFIGCVTCVIVYIILEVHLKTLVKSIVLK